MLLLSQAEVESIFTMDDCIAVVEQAYAELARGNAVNQPRTNLLAESSLAAAAARLGEPIAALSAHLPPETTAPDTPLVYIFKTTGGLLPRLGVGVMRINSEIAAFPVIGGKRRKCKVPVSSGFRYCGILACFSTRNGDPLAIMPDGPIADLFPGAKGAVGTKYLARQDASVLGVVGAGGQAEQSILATVKVRDIRKILVYSPRTRLPFAAKISALTGIAAEPVDTAEEAVRRGEIVITATSATEPVIRGEWLQPGTHLTAVNPREVSPDCLDRADLLVRTWTGEGVEQQEHVIPSVAHRVHREYAGREPRRRDALNLAEMLIGRHPGRTDDRQITYHDNASCGMQFAAACALVLDRARERGLGLEIPDDSFLHTYH